MSAVVMAALLFLPFYFGGISWYLTILVLGGIGVWEWVRMTDPKHSTLAVIIPVIALIMAAISEYAGWMMWILPGLLIAATLAFVERRRRSGEKIWAPIGLVYLIIPCIAAISLRGTGIGFDSGGFKLLLYLILVVIAADVGAYFGGSYFKGPKLVPNLSPKKTWSGFFSGIISGVIMGALLGLILPLGPKAGAILALPVVLISVVGDFIESAVKRRMNVKDASGIIPGHGGILDRLDSLLLVLLACLIAVHVYPIVSWFQA